MPERLLDGVPEIAGDRRCDQEKNKDEYEEDSQLGALLECRGARQILAQNHHSGNGIDGVFAVAGTDDFLAPVAGITVGDAATKFFLEQTLGFPAGQPLIDQFDRDANLFAQTFGETGGFFGHIAAGTIEAEWQADHDLPHAVITHEGAKAADILVAINALERVVWLGDAG